MAWKHAKSAAAKRPALGRKHGHRARMGLGRYGEMGVNLPGTSRLASMGRRTVSLKLSAHAHAKH